jgi:hypothetical protein
MNKAFLSLLVVLGASAATDALAQRPDYGVEYGREFRQPSEAGRAYGTDHARARRAEHRRAYGARARAESPAAFDGSWSVAINTRRGACQPSYRFGVNIIRGNVVYEGRTAGRVSPGGGVSVNVSQGGQQALGQGRLSRSYGSGAWRGYGSAGACTGTWQAVRR